MSQTSHQLPTIFICFYFVLELLNDSERESAIIGQQKLRIIV